MIARITIKLPFEFAIPQNEVFEVYPHIYKDFKITCQPSLIKKTEDSEI